MDEPELCEQGSRSQKRKLGNTLVSTILLLLDFLCSSGLRPALRAPGPETWAEHSETAQPSSKALTSTVPLKPPRAPLLMEIPWEKKHLISLWSKQSQLSFSGIPHHQLYRNIPCISQSATSRRPEGALQNTQWACGRLSFKIGFVFPHRLALQSTQ